MSPGTAFHPRSSALNSKLAWEDWQGYLTASVYADHHDIEYNAIREAVAAIDVSPLFKYLVSGPDATKLIDRVITRDATRLQVGQVYYTPWCEERGKVVDDGTITRLDETTYRWTAAEPNLRWIELNADGLVVRVEDVTDDLAALALQGPRSREVLEAVTGEGWADVRYYRRRPTTIRGFDVDVTRTGYTGDLGYELWVDVDRAVDLWDVLFDGGAAYGIRPVGNRAMDVARVEAGLILIDADFVGVRRALNAEQEYSPFEIGLGRLVGLKRETAEYVGKRALQAEDAGGGPRRRLVGVVYDWDGIERAFASHGLPATLLPEVSSEPVPLYAGRRRAGKVTSRTWSPMLKRMIALASVTGEHAEEGTRLQVEWTVEGYRHRVWTTVVPLPFLDLPRKRA
ncbi:MAG: aminomethyltransferase family protein [Actinomycetota bacterium]